MENKESIKDGEKYRVREDLREIAKEYGRVRTRRAMLEVVCGIRERYTGPDVHSPGRTSLFCGGQDDREEAKEATTMVARETEVPGFPGVRVRCTGTTPYYINGKH